MSAVRRDRHGVVLRYPNHDAPRGYHTEQKTRRSDRERVRLLRAERALLTIRVIGEHVLSDIAMTRLLDELYEIQAALNLQRLPLGLQSPEPEA